MPGVLAQPSLHGREKLVHEPFPHCLEREEQNVVHLSVVGGIAFRHKDMQVWMPLQVTAERVQERYVAELPLLTCRGKRSLSEYRILKGIGDGREEHVKHPAVLPEPWAEHLRDGEDELPVGNVV